jgi:hypothetical protein
MSGLSWLLGKPIMWIIIIALILTFLGGGERVFVALFTVGIVVILFVFLFRRCGLGL